MTESGNRTTLVDLRSFELESHVEESFRVAWALAEGGPVDAVIAVRAAVLVSRVLKMPSEAFRKLSSLFPIPDLKAPPSDQPPSASLGAYPFAPALASAFSLAEKFFQEGDRVWGRDYVTFVLLSGDPSLFVVAKQVNSTLQILQDEWFHFVTSASLHRSREAWERWWRRAGVPLPFDRSNAPKSTETSKTASTATPPTTLLFTWNPKLFPFSELDETARKVREGGEAVAGWSTGLKKGNVAVGDRVFLMRQGQEPRGLVGAGWVETRPQKLPHWDKKERAKNKTYHHVQVRWEVLAEEPLLPLPELLDRFGEEKLWSTQGGGRELPTELAQKLEAAWEEARSRAASRGSGIEPTPRAPIAPVAWIDSDAIPVIGGTDYRPSEHDSLDATEQAKIFATLLIAAEVQPPFALGLLGDWGVGKTFFMRLMQENAAAVAGKGVRPESASNSVKRAAQIEFNAWHYVDSDLWASLASHIFDGLAEELRGPQDEIGDIRRRLRREIHSSQKERDEAQAAIALAQNEHRAAAKELVEWKAERERVGAIWTPLRLKRVWEAVLKVKPDSTPERQGWPDLAKLTKRAEKVAQALGITEAIDGVEEAERVYRELRHLSRRGASLATSFAAAFTGSRLWKSGAVLLLLLALIVAWPWVVEQLARFLELLDNPLTERLLAPLLQLATAVGAAVAWAGRNVGSISSAMAYLEEIRKEIRQPRVQLENPTKEEETLRQIIEELDAEIAKETRRIEEADRQIAEAQAEIQRINAGGLVYDFLEGKVRDSRYLDRLGLISVIRNDFERLGRLLRDWQEHGEDGEVTESADAPIERIILYIDDLDRCPPKRVVEVLQAVHLILAFDLFVVVVAVDARWLERSLNEAYNPWTAGRDGSLPEEPLHRFSAHNYLEKIFQIPFSLPAMSEPGYRRLVADMMETPATWERRLSLADEVESNLEPEVQVETPEPAVPEGQGASADEKAKEIPAEEKPKRKRRQEQEEAERRIEAMKLREWEEQFISALYPYIGTPRLAKRFVNVYRLLRVRASAVEEDFSTFIDRDTGEYRAVLMLVALGVGRAEVAPEILEELHAAKGTSLREWLSSLSRNDAAAQIHGDIDAVIRALKEFKAPPFDDRLESYRKWAREVGRYSFRWHLRPNPRDSS